MADETETYDESLYRNQFTRLLATTLAIFVGLMTAIGTQQLSTGVVVCLVTFPVGLLSSR